MSAHDDGGLPAVDPDEIAATTLGDGLEHAHLALLAACASHRSIPPGTFLAREGGEADACYLVRAGRVAIEVRAPAGGVVVETLGPGDVVGWSWLFPPHRWHFDVEALTDVDVVVLDGARLREACAADPALDAALTKRLAAVVVERLGATRVRLLDLYGDGDG